MLMVLCCEGALRIRAWWRYGSISSQGTRPMYVFDPVLEMNVPRAGFEIKGTQMHVKINSLGFRGDEISAVKPAGTIRIVCTGASTTFCEEASSNETTWPARLQSLLRARYPGKSIEVVNAGITGSALVSSLKDVRRRLLKLDPDLVILYRANNDIVMDTRDEALKRGLVQPSFSRRSGLMAFLAKYSLLVHLIRTNIELEFRPSKKAVIGMLDGIPPDMPHRFVDLLGRMHDVLNKNDVPLLLSTFMIKFRRDQPRETQLANSKLAFHHMPWATMDDLLDAFDLYNDAIVKFGASRGIPVVEDRDSIPADDEHFADYMHLTDAGCELMAKRFVDFIVERDLLQIETAKPDNGSTK
jgi:lysophospholipase L1-like esterase